MAEARSIWMRTLVLAAAWWANVDGAAAGPFVLGGGTTNATALYDFNGSAIDQVFDLNGGVTSATAQIAGGPFHGSTASGESQVTASFNQSIISIHGSAEAASATFATRESALGRGTISGNVQFFVDTTNFYQMYGSFDSALIGGGTGFAKVRLTGPNTQPVYERALFSGGLAMLDFNDLVFLQAGSYVLTYQSQLDSVSTGVAMGSGILTHEAHLAVPEPSSLALVGGLAAVSGYWRRRRRTRQS